MKIIKPSKKKPEWPKRGVCDTCGGVVEVEQKDVTDMTERSGEPLVYGVRCPTSGCPRHIYFQP